MSGGFKWITHYEDETTIYEDGYREERHAREYAEEAKEEGYKNVFYFYRGEED